MLEPNTIPQQEPILRVGIVMPADKIQHITVIVPDDGTYTLITAENHSEPLSPRAKVEFSNQGDRVALQVNGGDKGASQKWRIVPAANELRPRYGLLVKGVVAGRGFHWHKEIDATYSGIIEVTPFDGYLLLVNELPLEHYIACVATSEMGSACPPALLESQTIVARSWMLANVEMKHRNLGLDVFNDDCCQRYQGTTFLTEQSMQGGLHTSGVVLMFQDKICDARYSKSCGGVSEAFENVWDGEPVPYLSSIIDAPHDFKDANLPLESEEKVRRWIENIPPVFCSSWMLPEKQLKNYLGGVDVTGKYFRWSFEYTQKQMTALLNLKLNLNAKAILAIEPVRRGKSGRLIEVRILYETPEGKQEMIVKDQYHIRETFHEVFLYSSAFVVDVETKNGTLPTKFILKGAGWGHGVGYCQIGALSMALRGHSTEEILRHYYPGARIVKLY